MMKKYVIMLAAIMLVLQAGCVSRQNSTAENTNLPAQEQSDDVWFAFDDDSLHLIGYKDKNGMIKIEPKFFMTSSGRDGEFNNVITVTEEFGENKWRNYFLTKTGKTFGIDSVHFFDNSSDHECEGFINFSDRKTNNVGLFDRNGNVVIPAEYNFLSKKGNGMIVALKGAERKYKENREHNPLIGGKHLLIDTLNNILIEDFPTDTSDVYPADIDFFSVKKTETPHPDTIRASFPAKGGGYYSFIVFKREFNKWLTEYLLPDLTAQKLIDASHDTISLRKFITDNFESMEKELLQILNPPDKDSGINIWGDTLYLRDNNSIGFSPNNLYNICDYSSYVIGIRFEYKGENSEGLQRLSVYNFLRTSGGYKLLGIYRR
jgi:hypothetical protein